MTEEQLRALVREAIARHLGQSSEEFASPATSSRAADGPATSPSAVHIPHPSHTVFRLANVEGGMCIIEPVVPCTHCGYCKSYGH